MSQHASEWRRARWVRNEEVEEVIEARVLLIEPRVVEGVEYRGVRVVCLERRAEAVHWGDKARAVGDGERKDAKGVGGTAAEAPEYDLVVWNTQPFHDDF